MTVCERLWMGASEWSDLRCVIKKSNLIEQYGSLQLPRNFECGAGGIYMRTWWQQCNANVKDVG